MKKQTIEEYNIKKTMAGVQAPDYLKEHVDGVLARMTAPSAEGVHKAQLSAQADAGKQTGSARKWRTPRVAAVAATAVLVIGGSVFAATQMFDFHIDQTAEYSAQVGISSEQTENAGRASAAANDSHAYALPDEVSTVEISYGYMTPNMEANYKGENSFSSLEDDFGYFISDLYLDEEGAFTQDFVVDSETLTIGGRNAAYVCEQNTADGDWLQQDLYVFYPEYNRVIYIWGWGHADKDEMIKIAENLEVKETGNMVALSEIGTWSNFKDYKAGEYQADGYVEDTQVLTASKEDMANLHQLGETFPLYQEQLNEETSELTCVQNGLSATVTDVQIADDLSLLNRGDEILDAWKELLNEDGTLKEGSTQYFKYGDGKETLDEIVYTETYPLKLVSVTVEYQNTTDAPMSDIWFMGDIIGAKEEADGWHIDSGKTELPDLDYDSAEEDVATGYTEMFYFDFDGRENVVKNYIPQLDPGESIAVQMAWIIPEKNLDKMFLEINGDGWDGFTPQMLATGLVDLRQ